MKLMIKDIKPNEIITSIFAIFKDFYGGGGGNRTRVRRCYF